MEEGPCTNDLLDGIFDVEFLDEQVQIAAKKCMKEGNCSSIIKLELKTKIQAQKLMKGEDYSVDWRQENDTSDQLTPEDKERRKELRERNKISARKHRLKKKEEERQLKKEIEELTKKNTALKQQMNELESLKAITFASLGIIPK